MERNFETALKELEDIIKELENKELSLQENIDKFKRGTELLQYCKKFLADAEISVKKIIDDNRVVSFEPYKDDL